MKLLLAIFLVALFALCGCTVEDGYINIEGPMERIADSVLDWSWEQAEPVVRTSPREHADDHMSAIGWAIESNIKPVIKHCGAATSRAMCNVVREIAYFARKLGEKTERPAHIPEPIDAYSE